MTKSVNATAGALCYSLSLISEDNKPHIIISAVSVSLVLALIYTNTTETVFGWLILGRH